MCAGVRALLGARCGAWCGRSARWSAYGVRCVVSALVRRGRGCGGCAAGARGEWVQLGQQGTKPGVSPARGQMWTPQTLFFSPLFGQNFGGRFGSGHEKSDICVGRTSSLRGYPGARADADGRGVPPFNENLSRRTFVPMLSVMAVSVGGAERGRGMMRGRRIVSQGEQEPPEEAVVDPSQDDDR